MVVKAQIVGAGPWAEKEDGEAGRGAAALGAVRRLRLDTRVSAASLPRLAASAWCGAAVRLFTGPPSKSAIMMRKRLQDVRARALARAHGASVVHRIFS